MLRSDTPWELWRALGRFNRYTKINFSEVRRLVFVCRGNICRSPYGEAVARRLGIDSVSGGIDTTSGKPANEGARRFAVERWVDLEAHRTSRVAELDLGPHDLVLAMEPWHLPPLEAARARGASFQLSLLGLWLRTPRATIRDPYGRGADEFHRVFGQIEQAVHRLALQADLKGMSPDVSYAGRPDPRSSTPLARYLKSGFGRALAATGGWPLGGAEHAIVAVFHSIVPHGRGDGIRCPVDDFERYCRFFKDQFDVVSLRTLVDLMKRGEPLAGRLAITFDDGYLDNATLAAPILRRLGLPATFFVTSGFIGSEHQAPWDARTGIRSRWMSWEDLRTLVASGFEIGAHSVDHPNFAKLEAGEVMRQLARSKEQIESQTGSVVESFALPFGRAANTASCLPDMAKEMGLRTVAFAEGGVVRAATDPYHLPRCVVTPAEYSSPFGWLVDIMRMRDERSARSVRVSHGT